MASSISEVYKTSWETRSHIMLVVFRGLHKHARAQHKGSPPCAGKERKEPDCAIMTVLPAHEAIHIQSLC